MKILTGGAGKNIRRRYSVEVSNFPLPQSGNSYTYCNSWSTVIFVSTQEILS